MVSIVRTSWCVLHGQRGAARLRVGYLGTHGLAHGLDVALRAAKRLERHPIDFVLVGDGAGSGAADAPEGRDGGPEPAVRSANPTWTSAGGARELRPGSHPSEGLRHISVSDPFEDLRGPPPPGCRLHWGSKERREGIVDKYGAGFCFHPESDEELADGILSVMSDDQRWLEYHYGCQRLAEEYDRAGWRMRCSGPSALW